MTSFERRKQPRGRHGSVEQEQPLPDSERETAPGEETPRESFDGAVGERAESRPAPIGPEDSGSGDEPL